MNLKLLNQLIKNLKEELVSGDLSPYGVKLAQDTLRALEHHKAVEIKSKLDPLLLYELKRSSK